MKSFLRSAAMKAASKINQTNNRYYQKNRRRGKYGTFPIPKSDCPRQRKQLQYDNSDNAKRYTKKTEYHLKHRIIPQKITASILI